MQQDLRFCVAPDGVRLAWTSHGTGPPMVKAGNWLTHLEYDWESPVWRSWLEGLGQSYKLVRYDDRGCGLSDRTVGEVSLPTWVTDLEAVVEAAEVERFVLLGISQGATVAVAYAVRHPERVERMILYGGYVLGRNHRGGHEMTEALKAAVRVGWDTPNPAFRRMFTMRFLPGGTPDQMAWYDELQRRTASAETAARLYEARSQVDVSELAAQVRVPTLVAHARGDGVVPFEQGRQLASLIPGAQFLPLESENHLLLPGDPALAVLLEEIRSFTGRQPVAEPGAIAELSARERDVMALVAQGRSNEQIAEELFLSVRTVERHLSNIYAKLRVSGKAARAAAAARFAHTG